LTGTLALQDTVTPMALPRFIEGTILQGSTILGKVQVEADASNVWWCATLPPTVSGPAIIEWDGSSFLKRRQPVTLTGASQNFGITPLVNGDVDNSSEVDAVDIDLVIADFGDVSVGNSDVDVSGEVDAVDIDIVIANFRFRHVAEAQSAFFLVTIEDECLHDFFSWDMAKDELKCDYFASTGLRSSDAVGASSCRSLRMPASTNRAGANLQSKRSRLANAPAA